MLQAEHQLIAQNANIGAARAAFFPSISLTATLGTISTALSGLFAGQASPIPARPAVSLPLFDAGRRKGNLDYARASEQAAAATYEQTSRPPSARSPTRWRNAARSASRSPRKPPGHRPRVARPAYRDARFRAGVDSFLTTLDAQRTAYAAEQSLVTTRLTRASNLVTLYRTLGGGLN